MYRVNNRHYSLAHGLLPEADFFMGVKELNAANKSLKCTLWNVWLRWYRIHSTHTYDCQFHGHILTGYTGDHHSCTDTHILWTVSKINPLSTDGHCSGHLAKLTFLHDWQIYIHCPKLKVFTSLVCTYFRFFNLSGVLGTMYKSMYSL